MSFSSGSDDWEGEVRMACLLASAGCIVKHNPFGEPTIITPEEAVALGIATPRIAEIANEHRRHRRRRSYSKQGR